MNAIAKMISQDANVSPSFKSALPQVVYTREDLLKICESHPHPAIRRIAADMLYTMGKRDSLQELPS